MPMVSNHEPVSGLSMKHQLRVSITALSPKERLRVMAMYGLILGLHALGFSCSSSSWCRRTTEASESA